MQAAVEAFCVIWALRRWWAGGGQESQRSPSPASSWAVHTHPIPGSLEYRRWSYGAGNSSHPQDPCWWKSALCMTSSQALACGWSAAFCQTNDAEANMGAPGDPKRQPGSRRLTHALFLCGSSPAFLPEGQRFTPARTLGGNGRPYLPSMHFFSSVLGSLISSL